MSVDTAGTAVAPYSVDEYGDVGLEDIGAADIIIPRLTIQHKDGTFKDNLSGAQYDELDVVLLGLVKQRIMWGDDPDDGDKPLCKSTDFDHGFPNVDEDLARDKRFPWNVSNFEPSDARPLELTQGQSRAYPNGYSSNGLPVLPCSSCKFQNWGTNPNNGKSVPPPCTEQHTYALMYSPDGENWITALLTLQRTGIKPSKQYISSFAQTKTPMFQVRTVLRLTQASKGTVTYSVPTFQRGPSTDRSDWVHYAESYRSIRDFIRSAPRNAEEDTEDSNVTVPSNVNTAPAPAAQPATVQSTVVTPPAQPAAPAAAQPAPQQQPPAPVEDDDDLPF